MRAAYLSAGISLPRISRDQFWAGVPVARDALEAGDLVFLAYDPADPATNHHVAMYVEKGLVVHAPHTGDVVRLAPLADDGYAGAVRIAEGVSATPVAAPSLATE